MRSADSAKVEMSSGEPTAVEGLSANTLGIARQVDDDPFG
jgi:hypothetical protein